MNLLPASSSSVPTALCVQVSRLSCLTVFVAESSQFSVPVSDEWVRQYLDFWSYFKADRFPQIARFDEQRESGAFPASLEP